MELYLIMYFIAAYFIGAFPTGYLMGRLHGVDIRKIGSGNPGAANVIRNLGLAAGLPVLFIDMGKAVLVVLAASSFFSPEWIPYIGGLVVIAGNIFNPFLNFKGGKAVATSAGVILGLMFMPFLMAVTIFIIVLFAFRYVSLASLAASTFLPIGVIIWSNVSKQPYSYWILGLALVVMVLVWIRHKSNIRRLLKGQENRIVLLKK